MSSPESARIIILPAAFVVFFVLVAPSPGQSPALASDVKNRSPKACSPPPGCDANMQGVLWPGGVVPYVFDHNVTDAQRAAMLDAMKEWENVSPVLFVARSNQKDYVHIKGDSGNWSHVGMIGGKQEIGIYNWNVRFQMVHELCHALGFIHEHQRPDRDDFVIIAKHKVYDPEFWIVKSALVTGDYDFDSVMHGDATSIWVNDPHRRILQTRIGQRTHLSTGDIRGMQIAYGAPVRPPSNYGLACTTTDFLPTFHTGGEFSCIGNDRFQLVSRNLTGGATGMVIVSTGRTSTLLAGQPVYVDLTSMVPLPCSATGSAGRPGDGEVTIPTAIPGIPSLTGLSVYLQGAFSEPGQHLGVTPGLWITIQKAVSDDISCLYDRKAYQRHVTSAQVGQAVWQANAVPGFGYVTTREFTCGGEMHWIVIVQHRLTGMEFCLIPGGSFRMGEGYSCENPVHWVRVEPFLLSKTEITQGQFQAVMASEPWKNAYYVKIGPDYAASYIDWYDACSYCARLGLRLPTESEWEYACRAGTTTPYHFTTASGPNRLDDYAWYSQNCPNQWHAHQAGQRLPNAFGLHDMYGNVHEWCLDRWHDHYRCAPTNGWVWEQGTANKRVMRGGCWSSYGQDCRSAYRVGGEAGLRSSYGIRVARSLR